MSADPFEHEDWKVTKAAGWTACTDRLPPTTGADVLVWRPWREHEISVLHAKYTRYTDSDTGKDSKTPFWYPGGSALTGTYWRALPRPPLATRRKVEPI